MTLHASIYAALGLSVALFGGGAAHAQDSGAPLSAIDWLEQAMTAPLPQPTAPPQPAEPDTTITVLPDPQFEEISTAPLGRTEQETTGLFTAERIGLPRALWGPTPPAEIIAALVNLPADTMPAAARLSLRLLMAEFAPPMQNIPETRGAVLLARVDKLVELGALQQAGQLIAAAPEQSAVLNARAFDIALLLGEEDSACAYMSGQIAASHSHSAQIFCTARRGNWQAAFGSLQASRSLGLLDDAEAALLTRFLEEEEREGQVTPPHQITPLGWRIMEALGDPVTTASLPVAYAHADLRGTAGWRSQLDAAERLTRAGVLQPNQLLGLYTQRRAAASGGLWERVRVVQRLDQAVQQGDVAAIGSALTEAWPLFAAVELEAAFAQMYADALADIPLSGSAANILWKILLLSQERLDRAAALAPDTAQGRFIMALAEGAPLPQLSNPSMAGAVHAAFEDAALPAQVQELLDNGAVGLVLLGALEQVADGAAGDLHAATLGLQRLNALGLDPVARQIAIELLLLDRRG
ncbi:MAG: hypothetical protein EA338_09125 [Roseinatronobacter sp.]|nr:MAG: hypothetical protein EA338_09125 [Roseinatronobacter sp.]